MPNYTTNILLVNPTDLKRFYKQDCLSLDKIVEQPKIFNKDRFSRSPVLIKLSDDIKETNEGITQEESDALIKKYKADNWYDWRVQNWGTKWDLNLDNFSELEHAVHFSTAWSTPIAALEKLCEKLYYDFEVLVHNEGEEEIYCYSYVYDEENECACHISEIIGYVKYDEDGEQSVTIDKGYEPYGHCF